MARPVGTGWRVERWLPWAAALLAIQGGSGCQGKVTGGDTRAGSGGVGGFAAPVAVGGYGTGGSASCNLAGSGAVPSCEVDAGWGICQMSSQPTTLRRANLLLLLDKSGSMSESDRGATSRWVALRAALCRTLSRSALTLNFGLDLFPRADVGPTCAGDACCAMPALTDPPTVTPGIDSAARIVGTLDGATPGGGTPAAEALERALEYYVNGDGANLTGDKYVLLVTDGGPDCLDGQAVVTQIDNLRGAGIGTVVVGLPGSDSYADELNAFAVAGGMPNPDPNATTSYYAVAEGDGVDGLTTILEQIGAELVKSCVIEYTKPPDDPNRVYVLADCRMIPRDPEDGGDGSYWTINTATNSIPIEGPACDAIIHGVTRRVDYMFGCPPF